MGRVLRFVVLLALIAYVVVWRRFGRRMMDLEGFHRHSYLNTSIASRRVARHAGM